MDDIFNKRFSAYFAAISVLLGFAYLFLVTFIPIPQANQRFADIILGFLMGTVISTILTYYFGSSKSSSDKNKIIENLKP